MMTKQLSVSDEIALELASIRTLVQGIDSVGSNACNILLPDISGYFAQVLGYQAINTAGSGAGVITVKDGHGVPWDTNSFTIGTNKRELLNIPVAEGNRILITFSAPSLTGGQFSVWYRYRRRISNPPLAIEVSV